MNTIECTCSAPIGCRHTVYCPVFEHEIRRDEELGLLPKSPPVERDAKGTLLLPPRMLANMIPGRMLGITKPAETATEQAQQERDIETFCKQVKKLRGCLVFPGGRMLPIPSPVAEDFVTNVRVKHEDMQSRLAKFTLIVQLSDKARRELRKFIAQATGAAPLPLAHVYPVWETDEHGEDREVWHGRMRIVRNRKRMRKLKRRGVMFMDLRAKTGNKHPDGYEGPRAWAWFTPEPSDLAHRELMHEIKDLSADEVFGDVPAGTLENVT